MFRISEKLARREPRRLKQKELSLLMRDVDTVWMGDTLPEGDRGQLSELADVSPELAARAVIDQLGTTDATLLADRLDALGVAYGVLRPNPGIPGGVYGVWRSELPMLLLTEVAPVNYDRPTEIARGLGHLIFYGQNECVEVFANELRASFVEVDGTAAHSEPAQPRTRLGAALGSLARRA